MSDENGNKLVKLFGNLETKPWANGIPKAPPPPPAPPPRGLPSWSTRPTVEGLYYNGKMIPLDGYHFIGCRFDNCTLLVASTNFELTDCVIDERTIVQYGVETMKIVQLFNSRHEWVYQGMPELAPRRNPDGTITINGMPT